MATTNKTVTLLQMNDTATLSNLLRCVVYTMETILNNLNVSPKTAIEHKSPSVDTTLGVYASLAKLHYQGSDRRSLHSRALRYFDSEACPG